MLSNRVGNAIALAFLVSPYCVTARAQIVPELETQPVSLALPPRNNPFVNPQFAQIEDTPVDEPLMVLPRIGATFQSGPEAGYGSSFGSLYAFVPFGQTYGISTFYTEGRFNLFTHDGEFGGNLRLGYRTLLPESDLVLGGYIGWDVRRTEFEETFHQLGFGADLQGEKWAVSANGYFPIGLTQREVANDFFDSGTVISNLQFSGNNLTFSRFRQQTTSQLLEAAMTGFDLEGGYQLLSWETGDLYAYGGAYFLDAPGGSSFVGVRGRLQAKIENFQAGISLQSDGNFGTNVVFNVGMIFGGNSTRKKEETPTESILARLGSGARRQETIAIDRQNEVTTSINQEDNVIAINPTTGQAWQFLHVTGGATGGSGTFESPFGQITDAMNIAQTLGNDVVYVDAGTNPGLNGFTLLDNVQVLSSGVTQFLDIQVASTLGGTEIFNTQLPGSGTGTLPLINGTTVTVDGVTAMVGIGNNSTLSGFDIQFGPANGGGVVASNVSGWTVERNRITLTGGSDYGIYARAYGGTITGATISGNTISTSGGGTINGISAYIYNGGTISDTTISGNTISTSGGGAEGIYFVLNNGTASNVTISGNTVSTSGFTDAESIGFAIASGTLDNITISGNTLSTSGTNGFGVDFILNNGTASNVTISGNTLSTSGTTSHGIRVFGFGPGTIANATITDNLIQQAGQHTVLIQTNDANANICIAQFTGNTSGMPNIAGGGGNDLNFNLTAGSTVNFVGFADIMSNNTGFDDISGTPTGTPTSCP